MSSCNLLDLLRSSMVADAFLDKLTLPDLYHVRVAFRALASEMSSSSCWLHAALATVPFLRLPAEDVRAEHMWAAVDLLRAIRPVVPAGRLEVPLRSISELRPLAEAVRGAREAGEMHMKAGGQFAATLLVCARWNDREALRLALEQANSSTPRVCVSAQVALPAAESAEAADAAGLESPSVRLLFAVSEGCLVVTMTERGFPVTWIALPSERLARVDRGVLTDIRIDCPELQVNHTKLILPVNSQWTLLHRFSAMSENERGCLVDVLCRGLPLVMLLREMAVPACYWTLKTLNLEPMRFRSLH